MTRSRKAFLLVLGGIVLFCCLGGWSVYRFSDLGRAEAELGRAVVDAKAAGLPWVASDLAQKPPVKDADNAAPIVSHALETMNAGRQVDAGIDAYNKARTNDDEVAEAAALDKLGPFIALARKAGDKQQCDFHRDWDQSIWLLFPEFAVEKNMAKVLSGQAAREAGNGQIREALLDLRRAVRLGQHAGDEPSLIGMLVQIACDGLAMRAVERIAEKWYDSPERLAALDRALGSLGPEADFLRALRGETYLGIALARNFPGLRAFLSFTAGGGEGTDSTPPRPKAFVRSGEPDTHIGRIIMCRHLQVWTHVWKDVVPAKSPIDLGDALDQIGTQEGKAGLSHKVNAIIMPVFSQAGRSSVTMRARRAVARGLVAVLLYRARRGHFPESLAEAGCKEKDPFTGRPLGFVVRRGEYRVYSTGPDQQDNGGTRRTELPPNQDSKKGWDEVASYPAFRRSSSTKGP